MDNLLVKRNFCFRGVIALLGAVVAVHYVSDVIHQNLYLTIILCGLAITLEAFPIPLRQTNSTLIIVVPIGAMVIYSPGEAIWIMVVACLIAPFIGGRKMPWSILLFNMGQYILSVYAGIYVFTRFYPNGWDKIVDWEVLAAALLSCLVYFVFNHVFLNLHSLVIGKYHFRTAIQVMIADAVHVLIALPFAFLMIVVGPTHPLLGPATILPLIGLAYILVLYRRTKDMQIVHVATSKLASEFNVEAICEEVSMVARRLSGADTVIVFINDETTGRLIPTSAAPKSAFSEFAVSGYANSDGGVIWSAIEANQLIYVPDTRKDLRVRVDDGDSRWYLSMIIYPMITHGIVEGAVVCYAERSYAFGYMTDHVMTLSTQASVLLENARLYRQLQERSCRDGVTGLYNYRYFYEALAMRTQTAAETGQPLSVAIMDIDLFKKFNDTYGHMAGDEVLKSLACLLREMVGQNGLVARYGGEEFALILAMDSEAAFQLVEQIRQTATRHVVHYAGYTLQGITFSSGVASCPDHAVNDRDLLLKADSTMYWGAKQRGRNRTAVYTPEFDAQLFVDELTGLYTFHFIDVRIREELLHGTRCWGAVCLDLANFGYVNTAFGFEIGDKVLRQASLLVRDCLRHGELACRYGGDEILVLLPNVNPVDIDMVGERIAAAIMQYAYQGTNNVLLSMRVRHLSRVLNHIEDAGELFDQIGNLFAELEQQSRSMLIPG